MRQRHESLRPFRSKAVAGVALGAVFLVCAGLPLGRDADRQLWGDEGTYLGMTASLVHDGDLVFDGADLERLSARPAESQPTLILQQTRRGITYSKPLLYSVVAVPAFAIFGDAGLVVTNVVALLAALIVTWVSLRQRFDDTRALWMLCALLGGSVTLAYLGWKMSDILLLAMTLAGLVLALGGERRETGGGLSTLPFGGSGFAALGGLLLGLAVSMRFTSAAIAAAAVVALVLARRARRAIVVAVVATLGLLAVSGLSVLLQGTANPYKAVRSSFHQDSGYPAGDSASRALERFVTGPATQSASWTPDLDIRRSAYSTLYFLIGRHTGMLAYFPVAILLLLSILGRPDRVSLVLTGGAAVVVGFYLLWMPENYFGGSTFLGNRYFLGVLPALLVATRRPPSTRALTVLGLVAAGFWGSALWSAATVSELDRTSQRHAHAGLFRRLPFESTAQRIDGVSERYWAGDFVRFLDPFATEARWGFRLEEDRPDAEILVATDWSDRPLHFVVSPDSAPIRVSTRDWRGAWQTQLPADSPAPPGLMLVEPSSPWRRHSYWWKAGRVYDSRVLRFSLSSTDQQGASAVVRYAGKGRELAPLVGELSELSPPLPTRLEPGSRSSFDLQLRNAGRRPWRPTGLFPVSLGYRWLQGARAAVVAESSVALPAALPPGKTLSLSLTVQAPADPGSYRLAIDLLRAPTGALGPLGRSVLATAEIRIGDSASPGIPTP